MWFNEENLNFILKKSNYLESSAVFITGNFLYLTKFVWKKKFFKYTSDLKLADNLLITNGILKDLPSYLLMQNWFTKVVFFNYKWYIRQSLYFNELLVNNFNFFSYNFKKVILKKNKKKTYKNLEILKKKNRILKNFIKFFNYKFFFYLKFLGLIDNQILTIESFLNYVEKSFVLTKNFILNLKLEFLSNFTSTMLIKYLKSLNYIVEKRVVFVSELNVYINIRTFLSEENYTFINLLNIKDIFFFWKKYILQKQKDKDRYLYLLFYKLQWNLQNKHYIKKRYFFLIKIYFLLDGLKVQLTSIDYNLKKKNILLFLIKNFLLKKEKDKFNYKIVQFIDYKNSQILDNKKNLLLLNIYVYYFENFLQEELLVDKSYFKKISNSYVSKRIKIKLFRILFIIFLKLSKKFKIKFKRKLHKFFYTYYYFMVLNNSDFYRMEKDKIKNKYFFFEWTEFFILKFFNVVSQQLINNINLVINYRFDLLYKSMFIWYQRYWKNKWLILNKKLVKKEKLFFKSVIKLKNITNTNMQIFSELYDLYLFDNYKYLTISNKNIFLKLKLKFLNYFFYKNKKKKKKKVKNFNFNFLTFFSLLKSKKNVYLNNNLRLKFSMLKVNKIYNYLYFFNFLKKRNKIALTKLTFFDMSFVYLTEGLWKDIKKFLMYFIFNLRSLFINKYFSNKNILNKFVLKKNIHLFRFYRLNIYNYKKKKTALIKLNFSSSNLVFDDSAIIFTKVLFYNSVFFYSDNIFIFNLVHDLNLDTSLHIYNENFLKEFNIYTIDSNWIKNKSNLIEEKFMLKKERCNVLEIFKTNTVLNIPSKHFLYNLSWDKNNFFINTFHLFEKYYSIYFLKTFLYLDVFERTLRTIFKSRSLKRIKKLKKTVFMEFKKNSFFGFNMKIFFRDIKYFWLNIKKNIFILNPLNGFASNDLQDNLSNLLFNFDSIDNISWNQRNSMNSIIMCLFHVNLMFLNIYFYNLKIDKKFMDKSIEKFKRKYYILYNKLKTTKIFLNTNKIIKNNEKFNKKNKNLVLKNKKIDLFNYNSTRLIDKNNICSSCNVMFITKDYYIFLNKLRNKINIKSLLKTKYYLEVNFIYCKYCGNYKLFINKEFIISMKNLKEVYLNLILNKKVNNSIFVLQNKLYHFSKLTNFCFLFKPLNFLILKNKSDLLNLFIIFEIKSLRNKRGNYSLNNMHWVNIAFLHILKKFFLFFSKYANLMRKTVDKLDDVAVEFERKKKKLYAHLDKYLKEDWEITKIKRRKKLKADIKFWKELKEHVLCWEKIKRMERTKNFLVFLYQTIGLTLDKNDIILIGDFDKKPGVEFIKWTRRTNPYIINEYLSDYNHGIDDAKEYARAFNVKLAQLEVKEHKLINWDDNPLNLKKHPNYYESFWLLEGSEKIEKFDKLPAKLGKGFYINKPGEPKHPYWQSKDERGLSK